MASIIELRNINTAADDTLQKAVTESTKNAAMMVDKGSQAKGDPHIAYENSINEFNNDLKYELGLDSSLNGNQDTSIKSLKYWVIIYNGDNKYNGYDSNNKVESYAYYTFDNGENVYISNDITGFPKTLYITDNGIMDSPGANSIKITVNNPGVIAVVQANVNPVLTNSTNAVTRWAFAKIVKKY